MVIPRDLRVRDFASIRSSRFRFSKAFKKILELLFLLPSPPPQISAVCGPCMYRLRRKLNKKALSFQGANEQGYIQTCKNYENASLSVSPPSNQPT